MKKRIIAIFMMLTLVFGSTACSKTDTSSVNTSLGTKGKYFCYSTYGTINYLDFLETFDYEEYEILDISCSQGYWYVTYRLKK